MSRRPLVLLGLAFATAAGAVAVWLVAFHAPGGRLDGSALESFTGVARPPLTPRIRGVADLADPWPFAFGAAGLIVIALLRRRWLMAAAVPAILLAANLTTQQLKPALADPRVIDIRGVQATYPGSWPSGHSTASMSVALCLVLVVGPRLRPLAALLGAGYAVAVGYSLVVLGFHLPSDVLGGYLVAATFTLIGAAALASAEARWPAAGARSTVVGRVARPPAALSAPALGALAVAGVVFAVIALAVGSPSTTLDVVEHPVAVLAGIGIAVLGLVLTTGLARVLRR
jgi:membrane-associated phospholipid phosphatase